MSNHAYIEDCPKCGEEASVDCCFDSKTGEGEGVCYECGYKWTVAKVESRLSLEKLNDLRIDADKEILKELPKWESD